MQYLLVILFTVALSGCSTLKFWSNNEAAVTDEAVGSDATSTLSPAASLNSKEVELRLAKLWAKVDDLEDLILKQKQRIAVLERGLMLGILPEELKNDADRHGKKAKTTAVAPEIEIIAQKVADEPGAHTLPPPAVVAKPELSAVDRPKQLADAQQFFEQGQYGRALAIYSSLSDEGDSTHRYWVGMCWFKLKEYDTAHKEFSDFLAKNPSGPWAPRAKYNLAQVDLELGYKEKALVQLRKIIEEYPNEDAAQMARASIQQMESNL